MEGGLPGAAVLLPLLLHVGVPCATAVRCTVACEPRRVCRVGRAEALCAPWQFWGCRQTRLCRLALDDYVPRLLPYSRPFVVRLALCPAFVLPLWLCAVPLCCRVPAMCPLVGRRYVLVWVNCVCVILQLCLGLCGLPCRPAVGVCACDRVVPQIPALG